VKEDKTKDFPPHSNVLWGIFSITHFKILNILHSSVGGQGDSVVLIRWTFSRNHLVLLQNGHLRPVRAVIAPNTCWVCMGISSYFRPSCINLGQEPEVRNQCDNDEMLRYRHGVWFHLGMRRQPGYIRQCQRRHGAHALCRSRYSTSHGGVDSELCRVLCDRGREMRITQWRGMSSAGMRQLMERQVEQNPSPAYPVLTIASDGNPCHNFIRNCRVSVASTN
jgi:hypothetical protein